MASRHALIEWLYSLQGPSLKWDIDTARAFCAALGHPERRFRVLHIAGTNGKGSVAAMAHAIALAEGCAAGLYTSPHLVRPEERIRVGADDIDSGRFLELLARLRRAAEELLAAGALPRHPSFFEVMTAAAFLRFAEQPVELAVVEAGLGGRLDATNVVQPELAVITTIGLDHVKTLGRRLAAIAGEKAGIIKPGAPVLVGWLPAPARAVIEDVARRERAPLHLAPAELRLSPRGDGSFDLRTPACSYRGLRPVLAGSHQARNAALAVRAMELLGRPGRPPAPEVVARGLESVRWPGRLERIPGRAVARELEPPPSFLLDGAHNPDGARALARALADAGGAAAARRVLLFGITQGRDAARLIAPLVGHVDAVVVTRPEIDKAVDPVKVGRDLRRAAPHLELEVVREPSMAVARAATLAGAGGEVLVAGSLYLVGDARRLLLGLDGVGHPRRETALPPAERPRTPGSGP